MSPSEPVHRSVRSPVKRVLDLTLAAVGLTLGAPLFVFVAALVYAAMGRPVVFRQVRAGYRATPFVIYKFRTMREARGEDGEPLPDAERITTLGRFLRKWSLDELPQFWNVIRGDLSLVGPRPQLIRYLSLYTPEQGRRHEVRPGITGWAQIHGRNAVDWSEKFQNDVWYVDHWSLGLDLVILLTTIIKVVRCEGVNEGGVETVTPFQGSTGGKA